MDTRDIRHLYWRAAFGASPQIQEKYNKMTKSQVIDRLFAKSIDVNPLTVDTTALDHYGPSDFLRNKENRLAFIQKSREKIIKLNAAGIGGLVESLGVL